MLLAAGRGRGGHQETFQLEEAALLNASCLLCLAFRNRSQCEHFIIYSADLQAVVSSWVGQSFQQGRNSPIKVKLGSEPHAPAKQCSGGTL